MTKTMKDIRQARKNLQAQADLQAKADLKAQADLQARRDFEQACKNFDSTRKAYNQDRASELLEVLEKEFLNYDTQGKIQWSPKQLDSLLRTIVDIDSDEENDNDRINKKSANIASARRLAGILSARSKPSVSEIVVMGYLSQAQFHPKGEMRISVGEVRNKLIENFLGDKFAVLSKEEKAEKENQPNAWAEKILQKTVATPTSELISFLKVFIGDGKEDERTLHAIQHKSAQFIAGFISGTTGEIEKADDVFNTLTRELMRIKKINPAPLPPRPNS